MTQQNVSRVNKVSVSLLPASLSLTSADKSRLFYPTRQEDVDNHLFLFQFEVLYNGMTWHLTWENKRLPKRSGFSAHLIVSAIPVSSGSLCRAHWSEHTRIFTSDCSAIKASGCTRCKNSPLPCKWLACMLRLWDCSFGSEIVEVAYLHPADPIGSL